MKILRIEHSGTVELSHDEIVEALLEFAKIDKKAFDHAISHYLRKKGGYTTNRIDCKINGGKFTVTAQVVKDDFPKYTRRNIGFNDELAKFFADHSRKGNKQISFDEAFESLRLLFPGLTRRKFYLYVSDKRHYAKRGFTFDSKSRLLTIQ